jgi:hypothetical protein
MIMGFVRTIASRKATSLQEQISRLYLKNSYRIPANTASPVHNTTANAGAETISLLPSSTTPKAKTDAPGLAQAIVAKPVVETADISMVKALPFNDSFSTV